MNPDVTPLQKSNMADFLPLSTNHSPPQSNMADFLPSLHQSQPTHQNKASSGTRTGFTTHMVDHVTHPKGVQSGFGQQSVPNIPDPTYLVTTLLERLRRGLLSNIQCSLHAPECRYCASCYMTSTRPFSSSVGATEIEKQIVC